MLTVSLDWEIAEGYAANIAIVEQSDVQTKQGCPEKLA